MLDDKKKPNRRRKGKADEAVSNLLELFNKIMAPPDFLDTVVATGRERQPQRPASEPFEPLPAWTEAELQLFYENPIEFKFLRENKLREKSGLPELTESQKQETLHQI